MGRLKLLFTISIVLCLIGSRKHVCADESIDDVAETLKLLEYGTKTINSLENNKEIILVLGNYGSGKATLCSYVTGQLEDLESLETANNTGEFLIHANKTERSGIETLFPELYLDENGVKWFNIPSFIESQRNISTEIATTFFTKQLIDRAESVKLVFVINHASLQHGVVSTDIMKLVSEASKLLKHFDHYKLSISLIATKVKEFRKIDGQYQPTPDDLIINSIGSYLQNLVNELGTTKDRSSTTDACIEFLETLLQSSEGVYTRIGIFRRPDEAGLLSEIPSMVQGRISIRKVVLENTEYARIRSDDFGHTLSEKYRGEVVDLAQLISQNISGTVRKFANGIENHFKRMSSDIEDFTELLYEFSTAEHVLSQLENNVNLTVKGLLTLITEIGHELEIPFDIDDLENIMNQQKYLELLEIVSVKKLPVSSNDWIAEFNPCLNYVAEVWLLFIIEMYERLSSNDVQSDVTRYNVLNLSDWGEADKPQGIKVDHDNFEVFLDKQWNYLAAEAPPMASTHRLDMVNSVLRTTLGDTVTRKCDGCTGNSKDGCTLTVQGRFVKTSNIDLDYCKAKTRNLNIFALETIFVDKDLILVGEDVSATFIAPKWDIVQRPSGRFKIAVNGATGPNTPGKAQSGTTISPDGQPGKPGFPGFNGGRMLAISQNFKNHDQLKLSADGGAGGKGQEGGDSVLDREGCGGKGGGGGVGGLAGNPGLLKVIPIDHEADIYAIPWKKDDGVPGANGKSVKHTKKNDWECENNWMPELKNFKGREEPKPQSKKVPVSGYIAYKHFVRENLVNSTQKAELLHFVDRMENCADILSQYEIKDLINDSESLESHFLKLQFDVDFTPFYQLLEGKILNFTEIPDNKNLLDSHKVVLNYLYSAAYSKLYSLKVNDESILVINILEYLNLIKERINLVTQIGKEQVINKYKNDYKKDVDVKINEANNLIKTEITPEFDNIYRTIDDKIADLVEDTIKLQKDKQTEIEKYKQQKKELERNIGLHLMLGAFKAIGQVVGFMGPYGAAAGSAINLGTSIGSGFVKDPDVKPEPFKMPDGISTALKDIGGVIEYKKKQKSKAIDAEIARLEEEIKKDPEVRRTLEETLTDITTLKDEIKKVKDAENPDQSKIDELEAKLPKLIKERQKQLKEKSEKPSKVVERSLKVISVATNALEVAETGIEIYNKFEEDREKIEQVGGLISESENNLQSLISYEKKIYDTFIPMMRGMRDDMENVEKNLESKSQVSLDVTKWKVQTHLKDLKSRMASFTKGYSVQEELGECIEKLTFALTTIINIFDRIQSYQDQQKLAIYIANINSQYIQNIQVHGEYRDSVTKLELLIQSNIIMQLFHNVVSSFKQHVFPFALQFLDSYKIPNVLKLTDDNDINVLKTNAIKQIEDMRTNMLKNLTTIQEIDTIVLDGEFNYEGQYLKPFYVWEYKERGEVIDQLLSGQKVFLRSDIKAGINFNAIKFRTININFKAKDPAVNVQLQDDLKKFGLILTHMGESYYKCDNNFYIISTESLPIEFSIAKGSSSSRAYEKLKSGNIMLSPYTSWKVKLIPGLQADPKKLEVYKGKVDLELTGSGQYVKNDVSVCNSHSLQRFYKLDKTTIHEPGRIDGNVLFEASPPSASGYLNLDEINYLL